MINKLFSENEIRLCKKHKNKSLDYYCYNDKKLCCIDCIMESKESKKYLTYTFYKNYKDQYKLYQSINFKEMPKQLKKLDENFKNMEIFLDELKEKLRKVSEEYKKQINEIIKMISSYGVFDFKKEFHEYVKTNKNNHLFFSCENKKSYDSLNYDFNKINDVVVVMSKIRDYQPYKENISLDKTLNENLKIIN